MLSFTVYYPYFSSSYITSLVLSTIFLLLHRQFLNEWKLFQTRTNAENIAHDHDLISDKKNLTIRYSILFHALQDCI